MKPHLCHQGLPPEALGAMSAAHKGVRPTTTAALCTSCSGKVVRGLLGCRGVPRIRGLFGGTGKDLFGEPATVAAVLALCDKPPDQINLLYLGTASYDHSHHRNQQTAAFAKVGVQINRLEVACATPPEANIAAAVDASDVILVSGGNTLFAVDRWKRAKLIEPLRKAMERGVTLCGGSAGAGCWFDGVHSDSMDPSFYRNVVLAADAAAFQGDGIAAGAGAAASTDWEYIRAPGLGFLPGLLCPHNDRTQSNGVPRSRDFDAMLLRHSGERGIAIDHYAALVCDGEGGYEVFRLPGHTGSVDDQPGVWIKEVRESGEVEARPAPPKGLLADLLRPSTAIFDDPRLGVARAENPSDLQVAAVLDFVKRRSTLGRR